MFIGCQFSIYPMSDNYCDIIINAIKTVEPYMVRTSTDDVSTTVIGNIENVFNYINSVYIQCLKSFDGHLAMSALFSIGCPDEADDKLCVESKKHQELKSVEKFDTGAQFAILPLKNTEYMGKIYKIIDNLKTSNLNYKHKHFCSYLRGDFIEVSNIMRDSFKSIAEDVNHVVMTANFSNRSPSH